MAVQKFWQKEINTRFALNVNKHIYKERIKFEDLRFMEQFLNLHDFMFKFDIKQGYHHIDIHKPHQKFVFTVLPFGLTSAPFIFKKVMSRKTLENKCDQNSLLS